MPRRRLLETLAALLVALAVAMAVVGPMMLGPALSPLMQALGGAADHRCACGMAPGTCGCPECARIEHQRSRERAPAPYAVLRSQCQDDEVAPGFSGLPLAIEAATGLRIARAPVARDSQTSPPKSLSRERTEPVTPPPRLMPV